MHDAVLVLVETFNKLLWKKPDMFKTNAKRTLSNGNSSTSSGVPSSQPPGLDCNSGRTSGNQWEHGEKISRYIRKVSARYQMSTTRVLFQKFYLINSPKYNSLLLLFKIASSVVEPGRIGPNCDLLKCFFNYNFVSFACATICYQFRYNIVRSCL